MNAADQRQMPLYPSKLCMESVGDVPVGEPIAHDDQCLTCGMPIKAGDLARKAHEYMNESFNNKHHLRGAGSHICGCCAAIWKNEWMQSTARARAVAIEGQGLFNLKSGDDIAWFLLTPPTAPYVAMFSTRKQAHMVWRTPVALPSDRFVKLRLNDEVMMIDRSRLLDGVRAYHRANKILAEAGKPKAVIAVTSPNLTSSVAGSLIENNARIVRARGSEGLSVLRDLRALSMADWWGLTAVRHVDLDLPSSWPTGRRM